MGVMEIFIPVPIEPKEATVPTVIQQRRSRLMPRSTPVTETNSTQEKVPTVTLKRQSKLTPRLKSVLETKSPPTEPEGMAKVSVIVSTSCSPKDVQVRGIMRDRHELGIKMPTA